MRNQLVSAALAALAIAAPLRADAARPVPSGPRAAKVLLSIEPLLIDAQGVHPLRGPEDELHEAGPGGAFYQTIALADSASLVYSIRYSMSSADRIDLMLERKIEKSGQVRKLPDVRHAMSPFESWTTSLSENGSAEDLRLRVAPVFEAVSQDEPFGESILGMQVYGGPFILYGSKSSDDRVIHRVVNVPGVTSLSVGVPGVGVFNLSPRPFPGSARCGWIRGMELYGSLEGRGFSVFSTREILPEDRSRPGKGWILYGKLERVEVDNGFYGVFDPSKPWRNPEAR